MNLRTLSERINKEITIHNNDVAAHFLHNQREIQQLANISLSIMQNTFSDVKTMGHLKNLPQTQKVFSETLTYICDDIHKHGRWSFWHYSGLCLISCFAYLELLKANKHQTIDLSAPKTWANPDHEVAIITINYIAGRLYPKSLARLQAIGDEDDVDVSDLCGAIKQKIDLLHQ